MRIKCPCCGERGLDEFLYYGDATVRRPDPAQPSALQDFIEYTYQRRNPRGPHQELWYHSAGCHSWLVVERNTATHAISSVQFAKDVAAATAPQAGRSA
jgi:sarcosine oxidase subunit delta